MKAVEKSCVVCGAKSHRIDWQTNPFPACDIHSKEEVDRAKPKAIPNQPVTPIPSSAPSKSNV
jgi:hypothetical protein